ncbi:xanthine dehydrogenase/oxidase-like [Diadema antillarum]|uniref:xanthine dehydrogenase/oxidase-like n=1 Tax=Diadema antillarum TaxID=105358 RepID=UPI003A88EF6E
MADSNNHLVFFCNGKRVVEKNPGPDMNLLTFLRNRLGLKGSKLGCAEGGCGSCTVMISSCDSSSPGNVRHRAVNACLVPVCSVHGAAVTTVEGIGSVETKLHPVQERIAKAHGTQCGFCTPGMVMSMYALLRNNPQPTMEEVQAALEGNLCRCTGYRPILQGYKTFTEDFCCGGKCRSDQDLQYGGKGDNRNDEDTPAVLFDPNDLAKYDPTQDIIFPPELMLASSDIQKSLVFRGERVTWYRPVSLQEVLELKTKFPDARLVAGNTEIGIEMKFGNRVYSTLVSISHVPELTSMEVSDDGVVIGSSVTLSRLEQFLKPIIHNHPGHKTKVFSAIVEMLRWFAGSQIRNMAAVGGNIVTGSPISDLNPIFLAARCKLELVSQSRGSRYVTMDENFFTGYRQNILMPDEILRAITIPYTRQNEYFFAFKQSPRREDDIAIVNAGMRVVFGGGDTAVVDDVSLAFGGMAITTVMASKTMALMKGRSWDNSMLEAALSSLENDLPLPAGAPGGMETYRKSLTLSFFFKFYLMVLDQLGTDQPAQNASVSSRERSAISPYQALPVDAAQVFEKPAPGQPSRDPVGRPVVHKAALQHATGEAVYVDDIPDVWGQLYMSFVYSRRAHAKIISLDPSEALSLEGVHEFVSASDVPASNIVGALFPEEELFASEEVFHVGQPIGAILAESQALARRAANLVKIEFEDLDAVITIEEAIEKESFMGEPIIVEQGDPVESLKTCDHVIEGEVKVGGEEHFYLETQCAFVIPKGEDKEVEVFSSTQHPTNVQSMVSSVLGIPANRITCRVKRLGGGFGGKELRSSPLAAACAVAANKVGRPVRFMMDRDEDMQSTGGRHPFVGRYKVGFTTEGRLQAFDVKLFSNGGFSFDVSPIVMSVATKFFDNCYRMPVFRIEGRVCRTNISSNTAFRGFGAPQGMIIMESIMTNVAIECGISQEKVRELNFYKDGDIAMMNQKIENCNIERCWEQCLEKSNFYTRRRNVDIFNRENRWKKRGLAIIPVKYGIGCSPLYFNQGAALVHIYMDGSVLVTHGGVEMGQGLHTKMIQVAARTLGIPEDKIHLSETSSSKVPNTLPTAASLGSDLNGGAVQNACHILRERLEPIMYANPKGTWKEWAEEAFTNRISLSATGHYSTQGLDFDEKTMTGKLWHYFSYGAAASEVEIDCLTGDHRTLRTDIVFDVGQSINPAVDIGQIEGAFIQGYGLYVLEDLRWTPEGRLLTAGPGYYKIPGFGNIPAEFNVTLVKGVTNPTNICSSKAIGEPPLFLGSSVYFAIKDAIMAARTEEGLSGDFRLDTPAVAERIRLACRDQFTKRFQEPENGTYQPFFVRP